MSARTREQFEEEFKTFSSVCLEKSEATNGVYVQKKKSHWNMTYASPNEGEHKISMLQGYVSAASGKGYVYFAKIYKIFTAPTCKSGPNSQEWTIPYGFTAFETGFGVVALLDKYWKSKNVSGLGLAEEQEEFFLSDPRTNDKRIEMANKFAPLLPPTRIRIRPPSRPGMLKYTAEYCF